MYSLPVSEWRRNLFDSLFNKAESDYMWKRFSFYLQIRAVEHEKRVRAPEEWESALCNSLIWPKPQRDRTGADM